MRSDAPVLSCTTYAEARCPPTFCLLEIQLDLRHSQNLKEKRKVVASLKAQLRQRFVAAAVAETADHDDRRRA